MSDVDSLLDISGLTVAYDGHKALDTVDLDINASEIMGLIGPNGAGKSSLIKALCGHIKFKSGTISLDGTPFTHGQARHDVIGLVPQDIALYGHMTARENLDVFARLAGLKRKGIAQTVQNALTSVNMLDKADWQIDTLSGGMKRRINIAAAIMHSPKVLILDEPMAGVDVAAQDIIQTLIRDLAQQGLAILWVSHDLEAMEHMCDRISLLSQGKTLIQGTPTHVLNSVYGTARQALITLEQAPTEAQEKALRSKGFDPTDIPTQWQSLTDQTDLQAIQDITSHDITCKEVVIRRPGLSTLMHYVERTGELP